VRGRGCHIFYTVGSQVAVRLSALRAGRPLPPRKISGTHLCLRLSRPRGHNAAGNIRWIEESNDLIGNRNRDLSTCSIVPQPTMLPCAPSFFMNLYIQREAERVIHRRQIIQEQSIEK
jgi:hypothetical protein